MNIKAVVRAGLLAFVTISVITLIVKSLQRPPEPQSEPPHEGVALIYFYSNTRCAACQRIEDQAHHALTSGFPQELRAGKLHWRTMNYERFENMRLARRYQIAMPMVVVTRWENGDEQDWRRLDRVWDLRTDREAFLAYVQAETRAFLANSDLGEAVE